MKYQIFLLILVGMMVMGCTENTNSATQPIGTGQTDQNVPPPSTIPTGENIALPPQVEPTPETDSIPPPIEPATGSEVPPAEENVVKEFSMTARNWEFEPNTITVQQGDTVKLHITSVDVPHGFKLAEFGVSEKLEPNQPVDVEFVADKKGTYTFSCNVFCGEGHKTMKGQLIVE